MNILEKFRTIRTFIFDIDGVMTNSNLLVLDSGRLLRTLNVRDTFALKLAIEKGYNIVIITATKPEGVIKHLQSLGITEIYYDVKDKLLAFQNYVRTNRLSLDTVLYMADDLTDYQPMRLVGLSTCPNDAVNEIISIAQYISPRKGGEGCVRDVVEKTLKLQGDWAI